MGQSWNQLVEEMKTWEKLGISIDAKQNSMKTA